LAANEKIAREVAEEEILYENETSHKQVLGVLQIT
jgi:hypothetical protein